MLEKIVLIQNLIFVVMDSIICLKTLSKKLQTKTQRTFFEFAIETTFLQFAIFFAKLIAFNYLPMGSTGQYFVYSFIMVFLCFCGFSWFRYFLLTIPGHREYPLWVKFIEATPVLLMAVCCAVSPWNHWIFYIDSALQYQRGTLFILQTILPYIYLLAAIIFIIIYLAKRKWSLIKGPIFNFFCFIAPSFVGAVLQIYVYSGGYTQIGISFGLLLMYLNMYVEEIKENERLQSLHDINKQLHEANNRISAAFSVIDGLSQEYHTIFIIDRQSFNMQLVRSTGRTTIQDAVTMALECSDYETVIRTYIDVYVMEQDQERLRRELCIAAIANHIDTSDGIYAVNYLRKTPDGKVGYHQIAIVNAKDDSEKKQFILGFRDVDQLVKSEIESRNKLIELQKRDKLQLETIAEAINGGFKTGIDDEDFTFTFVSKQLAAMLGYTVDEFMKASGGCMKGITDNVQARSQIPGARNSIENGQMYTMHYRMRCKDGTWKNVEERGRQVISTTGKKEFWSFIYDRDEIEEKSKALELAEAANKALEESKEALIKATETAEAASSAKTSFLFNMSHDIRTPMNAIIGFARLLEKNQEDAKTRADYIKKIQDSSSVLLSIINNVLEMARIEKGTLELVESVWDVSQFSDNLFSVFDEMMTEKGITYTKTFDTQHNFIYCDVIKLREIFLNLLSNAYKYTNEGGTVSLSVKEYPCDRDGYVIFKTTISDTGIGMSDEFLPHIFEEFSREKNTTDAKIEGTGLGMPIVKRLLNFMDGTIEVESQKNKGTKFTVTIPHRIGKPEDVHDDSRIESDPELFTGKRILLAEDNELNAEIAVAILNEIGLTVDVASDGEICCNMLKDSSKDYYDLILMDVQMPNMNGYEATKKIRSMDDKNKAEIPIIAMTANAFEEDRQESMKAGMNGHLAKPIDITELKKQLCLMINR